MLTCAKVIVLVDRGGNSIIHTFRAFTLIGGQMSKVLKATLPTGFILLNPLRPIQLQNEHRTTVAVLEVPLPRLVVADLYTSTLSRLHHVYIIAFDAHLAESAGYGPLFQIDAEQIFIPCTCS